LEKSCTWAGADAVYDAAFRRAGLLRVYDLEELFDGTKTLGRPKPPGKRVAILPMAAGAWPISSLPIDHLVVGGERLGTASAPL
jgi:acetyltransferase